MANDYYYSVSLSILHPSIDPKDITAAITELHPTIEAKAGSIRRNRDGEVIIPPRHARYSHWLADLHPGEQLFSGDVVFSAFLLLWLGKLEHYRSFFSQLREEGEVTLVIAWYSIANYSAEMLPANALKKCGELGLNIELNLYWGPSFGVKDV
jgi:hypothetical protein